MDEWIAYEHGGRGGRIDQRLTQVKAFLALARPVFFLSTILGSLFKTPSLARMSLTYFLAARPCWMGRLWPVCATMALARA